MPNQILPKINNGAEIIKICRFLKREFEERQKDWAIVGVSGGVDSSLTAELCQRAGLKVKKVFMPYGKVSKSLKGNFFKIDITKAVDALAGPRAGKISKGNIMARVRMIVLYDLARKFNGLVVGTENLSEYCLGYFTLHGDQASDINPISSFFKTQVMELARYLGLAVRTPSAELWEGQTDEKELGFSYEDADPILYLYCIKKMKPEKIIKVFALDEELVYKVIEKVNGTGYKRREVPQYESK